MDVSPPQIPSYVTVLCYHTFDRPKPSVMNMSSQLLAKQLQFLATQRIPVISLQDLDRFLYQGKQLPPRSVVITIDDGYRTAKTIAWPLMKKHGFPFTSFLYTQAQKGHLNALSWQDIRLMSKEGVDFQSHSVTHPFLVRPPKNLEGSPIDWLRNELKNSKREIESQVSKSVEALAYPYGGYSEEVLVETMHAGYRLAFTCDEGTVSAQSSPLRLPRRIMYPTMTWKRFVGLFHQEPFQFSELRPRPGEKHVGSLHEIRGRFKKGYRPQSGSLKFILDCLSLKPIPVQFDAKDDVFVIPLSERPKTKYCYANLWGRSQHQPAATLQDTWFFEVKQ